jgi:hypothetical protein
MKETTNENSPEQLDFELLRALLHLYSAEQPQLTA